MKKILLVSTLYDPQLSQYGGITKLPSFQTKGFMVPLNLATLAALTDDDIEVDLWDESVHGWIDEATDLNNYDLVGISCFVHRLPRAKEVAKIFRKRGIPVAIGGPGVSSAPERCRDDFDILFIGEAELTWPQFIADWKAGNYRKEYRQVVKPDMALSPLPRWDALADNMKDYLLGAVQTTRGCPFDCEFCDVIYLYGRQPRYKAIDQVLEEVRVLESLGMRSVFFCDDNFIGNPRYAKDLLREVIALNRTFEKPLAFQTQITINVAKDDELLELLADANFSQLFMGIESPKKESLIEANKSQNYRTDLVADIKKVLSYGLPIKAGMIVGFDNDDVNIFDEQFEFLQEMCIPMPSLNILEAPDGTKLWARLYKEGRIVSNESRSSYAGQRFGTNIIPKQMTRAELFEGYAKLTENCSDWNNFAARMKCFVSGIKRRPNIPNAPSELSEADLDKALAMLKMARNTGMINSLPLFRGGGGRGSGLSIFRDFFLLEEENARNAIFDIIRHTLRHAPFMLEKVIRYIALQYGERLQLQPLLEAIRQHIEDETTGTFKLKIAQGDILVPESFKEPYKEVFPEIYERVYTGLKDKSRTEEALIEIFTDFIVRWGQTFEKFEEYHRTFLFEIADRTIKKEDSALGDDFVDTRENLPNFKNNRLADDILKYVEQELRGIRND
jgi:radical SAM superfamily enzyme YgiQ (UPF0313 family)